MSRLSRSALNQELITELIDFPHLEHIDFFLPDGLISFPTVFWLPSLTSPESIAPQMPLEDMEIKSAAFAGSVISEGFGKKSITSIPLPNSFCAVPREGHHK
jgi:hypothetical protein